MKPEGHPADNVQPEPLPAATSLEVEVHKELETPGVEAALMEDYEDLREWLATGGQSDQ